eukprot:2620828-Rhodomonas_salina.1
MLTILRRTINQENANTYDENADAYAETYGENAQTYSENTDTYERGLQWTRYTSALVSTSSAKTRAVWGTTPGGEGGCEDQFSYGVGPVHFRHRRRSDLWRNQMGYQVAPSPTILRAVRYHPMHCL